MPPFHNYESPFQLHCCGVNGYKDWLEFSYGNETGDVALGCCRDEDAENCYKGMANKDEGVANKTIYTQGCYQAIKDDLQGVTIALGVVTVILGLVQVSIYLCFQYERNSIHKKNDC